MAHDNDIKIKVRAFYECNSVSMSKVYEHFTSLGYEVKQKTMEHWSSKEKWQKNKYSSIREAVSSLLPIEVMESVSSTVKDTIIDNMTAGAEGIIPSFVDDGMVEAVSEELIWQQLNKKALMGELAQNLKKTKIIANSSASMSIKATYHGMILSTIQTVHGKKVEMIPQDPSNTIMSNIDAEKLSTEELLEIMEK